MNPLFLKISSVGEGEGVLKLERGVTMVVKIINGMRIHEPPYTQTEEDEFYRRVGRGPITVARPAGDRKEPTSPSPRQQSQAKPGRARS